MKKEYKIQLGDKFYIITRRDLPPGCQAAQAVHAKDAFTYRYPIRNKEWYKQSNYIAVLSVKNEIELMRLIVKAADKDLNWILFREPDYGGEITAIAIEPHPVAKRLCSKLPLALAEYCQFYKV